MSGYRVAHLDEIEEVDDRGCSWRPVRHHLGITAFGINTWTARDAGDWMSYEHDESDEPNESLYLVQRGRAVFELDGERLDAHRYVRLCPARYEAQGARRGAGDDDRLGRRRPGKGIRARRLGDLGATQAALRGR
jgi:hypothetical protein